MNSQRDFQKLIDQLDNLCKRSIKYINRNIKDSSIKQSSNNRVEKLFDEIKHILELSRSPHDKEVRRFFDRLREEPGVKIHMDRQKDYRKIIDQLAVLKKRSLNTMDREIKDKDLKQSSNDRLEELFDAIKQILEQSRSPFEKEVQKIIDRMRVEPGVKIRSKGLSSIEGIGERFAQTLKDYGIRTTVDLLGIGATRKGRTFIEKTTGISNKLVLDWVNRVDLSRIRGVGEDYADLLEASGVDTVPELAQRNPQNLHQKLVEVNAEKKLVRQLPGEAQLANWIEQAKNLPRVIKY
jgi:predicted flap endonuclease-1-like 5' DNA nuclease